MCPLLCADIKAVRLGILELEVGITAVVKKTRDSSGKSLLDEELYDKIRSMIIQC